MKDDTTKFTMIFSCVVHIEGDIQNSPPKHVGTSGITLPALHLFVTPTIIKFFKLSPPKSLLLA